MKILRMRSKLPAAPLSEPTTSAAGVEARVMVDLPVPIAPLDPAIHRDMRWCINCGGRAEFIEAFETEFGRVGVCMGCGEEKFVPFTRTTEAVA